MIAGEEFPITMVQVVIVRKKGKVEQLKSIDIPVRNPSQTNISLDSDNWGVELQLFVPADPSYTIQYVVRDEQAAVDGKLPPYTDGIYSDQDVEGFLMKQRLHLETEITRLEKKLKRRDTALRKLRRKRLNERG